MSGAPVYYNDNEPFVCDWLENLIREKLLPQGVVDRRPIQEVEPSDVRDFAQCHFFAGIGGWAYALQLAGWGDRPVWTGSCPCQPFSAAGQRKSHADDRHLWPAWCRLIRERHPDTVFGEQVSGAAGLGWLDAVALDLEAADYAVGSCVLGAHSVGAPHLRQRLYFVADRAGAGQLRAQPPLTHREDGGGRNGRTSNSRAGSANGDVGDTNKVGLQRLFRGSVVSEGRENEERPPRLPSGTLGVAYSDGRQPSNRELQRSGEHGQQPENGSPSVELAHPECNGGWAVESRGRAQGPVASPWNDTEWLHCRDGKARPVEPGTFPLAHGVPARVGRLRAYGNAIVPQVAAAFISAYLECLGT